MVAETKTVCPHTRIIIAISLGALIYPFPGEVMIRQNVNDDIVRNLFTECWRESDILRDSENQSADPWINTGRFFLIFRWISAFIEKFAQKNTAVLSYRSQGRGTQFPCEVFNEYSCGACDDVLDSWRWFCLFVRRQWRRTIIRAVITVRASCYGY